MSFFGRNMFKNRIIFFFDAAFLIFFWKLKKCEIFNIFLYIKGPMEAYFAIFSQTRTWLRHFLDLARTLEGVTQGLSTFKKFKISIALY